MDLLLVPSICLADKTYHNLQCSSGRVAQEEQLVGDVTGNRYQPFTTALCIKKCLCPFKQGPSATYPHPAPRWHFAVLHSTSQEVDLPVGGTKPVQALVHVTVQGWTGRQFSHLPILVTQNPLHVSLGAVRPRTHSSRLPTLCFRIDFLH